jgi:hypothetical protein
MFLFDILASAYSHNDTSLVCTREAILAHYQDHELVGRAQKFRDIGLGRESASCVPQGQEPLTMKLCKLRHVLQVKST